MNDTTLMQNRFSDMAERAAAKGLWVYSDFLTEAEQSALMKMRLPAKVSLFGGYESAERRLAVFGDEADIFYPAEPPVTLLCIAPLQKKFADALTHRDFLGSLMALGIKREMLGDILVSNNAAYVFCLEKMADYIINELKSVKHTSVCIKKTDKLPPLLMPETKRMEYIVSSERLDVLIAAVYDLSRSESQRLVDAERVFVNSIITKSASAVLKPQDKVSVRGYGRFLYIGVVRTTKKGRSVVAADKF